MQAPILMARIAYIQIQPMLRLNFIIINFVIIFANIQIQPMLRLNISPN